MTASERDHWEQQGREIIRLDGLRPWGTSVALFHEQRRRQVMGLLEQGSKAQKSNGGNRFTRSCFGRKKVR